MMTLHKAYEDQSTVLGEGCGTYAHGLTHFQYAFPCTGRAFKAFYSSELDRYIITFLRKYRCAAPRPIVFSFLVDLSVYRNAGTRFLDLWDKLFSDAIE